MEADRGAALLVGRRDRFLLAQTAVEPDREAPRHVVARGSLHPDHAIDVDQQRLGLALGVAGAEHDQLDRGARGGERLLERGGRDHLRLSIGALEVQACRAIVPVASLDSVGHGRVWLDCAECLVPAFATEVHDGGPQSPQFAK